MYLLVDFLVSRLMIRYNIRVPLSPLCSLIIALHTSISLILCWNADNLLIHAELIKPEWNGERVPSFSVYKAGVYVYLGS
jgi:hypothetical protein